MLKKGLLLLNLTKRSHSTSSKIKLTLYTKQNCSLCDQAKEAIEELYPNRFHIDEVDITKSRELFRKFKFDIPVFYHENKFLMQHRIDKEKLSALVNQIKD